MEHSKRDILLHLYGETPEDSDLRELLRDDELRREYQALSEVKFRLDHRPRERPDPAVLDAVLAHAGGEPSAAGSRRGDRPPAARRTALRRLLVPALSIAAALVVAFGLGWWANTPGQITSSENPAPDQDMPVTPEPLNRVVPPFPDAGTHAVTDARTGQPSRVAGASTADPKLAWDDPEPLDFWYRRIESLEAASDPDGWGVPAVPLEMLPGSDATGLLQVGTTPPDRRRP